MSEKLIFVLLLAATVLAIPHSLQNSKSNMQKPNKTRISKTIENNGTRCGFGPYETPKLLIGETDAMKNSWPSMVALTINNHQFCGGTLIDPIHVLTAAHCVHHMMPRNVSKLRVALGMHRLKPVQNAQVTKTVSHVVYHKDYNAETFHNDIAILKLESPVVFTSAISPICLPPLGSSDQHAYKEVVSIGWGIPVKNGTHPDVLQQVPLLTITNAECRRRFVGVLAITIADHMICAFYPKQGTCDGDSGGPLLVQEFPGEPWVQIGIVSWGIGCAEADYPGGYTRTSSFVDWITKFINSDGLWPELKMDMKG